MRHMMSSSKDALQALCQSEGDRELDRDAECGRRDKQDNNANGGGVLLRGLRGVINSSLPDYFRQ